jgi:uncharacterized protein (TIGR00725 family)
MKLAIGVMGASGGDLTDEVRERAYRLGEAIAEHDAILVTGACPGLPYEAVRGAKAKSGLVVGISPGAATGAAIPGRWRSSPTGSRARVISIRATAGGPTRA